MEDASHVLLAGLRNNRLLAIIRGNSPDACFNTAMTLIDAGITIVEVSLTTAGAFDVIGRIAEASSGRALLGAGTVLTSGQVREAHDAGAQFIVTPCLAPSTGEARSLGLPVLVGALTPAEVYAAWREGATAVKLFPASVGGPAYLKALRDPFPEIPFVPVGGVSADSVTGYLQAGALAVGAGSPLTGDAPRGGSLAALAERARNLIALAQEGRALAVSLDSSQHAEGRHQWTS
ncbi:bifunctional 4-hydroxy-2-oxoglutarate aldolase/2-dehydro-3-deoxy-phosphogluconate aldolase [Arthrobacter sp. CDRTa11]|uniref:bifunctional 4-hydroxy-2-oxoglutarate aldolase/2-dehydro-3-deoxy-phosphogluconate aldolase n=1 Tax=Arthrobacter sp. CDRTa11 TaxID=2651199 RepID=UPI002265AABC|nr:bifunctional 4-hydroxy-2-oxoglutarate aldolase/2-dehydro-3-deoxy-phosphogluconate aldolase [Arthrobacter sp. CDRTa11]UZX01372.1 bifunctional 4-hydroxy-2-oxoglutarate aldolase/2-dehydro-3-deoxy-phosphogluconate aldolase [Arthrobacter sp. CDRTa11]